MAKVREQTISGFNEFLTGQRHAPGRATLTLIQFDSMDPHEICGRPATPVEEVPELDESTYVPRASTPLWDALGMAIGATEARLKALTDDERPDDVLFVVVTDGYENASREFSSRQVIQMVSQREAECGWRFIYLGADIDTFFQGYIGSSSRGSASIAKSKIAEAMRSAGTKVAKYRKSGILEELWWTKGEREDLS